MKNIIDAVLAVLTILIPRLKKPDSKFGDKETKEAVVALNELALFLAVQLKDGFQGSDFSAIYEKILQDHTFKAKLLLAYENYAAIPDEVSDLDVGEGLELIKIQTEYLPLYLEAFKKKV